MEIPIIVRQVFIFVLLWIAYGACYLLRKPFGIVENNIKDHFELYNGEIGYLDFSYALPYAFCSICLVFTGSSFNPKFALAISLIGSAMASSLMGLVRNFRELCILAFISGFFQSAAWPNAVPILYTWFDEKSAGVIMSAFSCCIVGGNIVSSLITVRLREIGGWRHVFQVPSLIVGIIGILILMFANSREKESNNKLETIEKCSENTTETSKTYSSSGKIMNRLLDTLKIPTLLSISIANFFNKGLISAVAFWLPLYLQNVHSLTMKQAGLLPNIYEIGGLVSSMPFIMLLERFSNFSDIFKCCLTCGLCILSLLLFTVPVSNIIYLSVVLFLSGSFVYIIGALLSGPITAKLGSHCSSKVAVVGLINGIGSFGSVIQGPTISYVKLYFGTEALIPCLAIMCSISLIFLVKSWFTQRKSTELELKVSGQKSDEKTVSV